MRVTFFGVRGSTPAPGAEFLQYGGHTSCVAFSHDGEAPTLVVDGGTGIRKLSTLFDDDEPFRGTILLSHLHWDHVHGLPFFGAGSRPGHRARVYLPAPDGDPVATLARGLSPPHFPIGPEQIGAGWTFEQLTEGAWAVEKFEVLAREIPHKGGQTFGFRVSDGRRAVAYLSDHAPLALGPGPDGQGELHPAAMALAEGVDVLIHGGQYLASEFPGVAYLGHASVEYACALAAAAEAASLVLFHHSPNRTDTAMTAIVEAASGAKVPVTAAFEGMVLDL